MKKILPILLLNVILSVSIFAQTSILFSSFEGPGFDEGWTTGVSQAITEEPVDYPETGLPPWEKWGLTETLGFGYVHSGDSAAFIGGTLYQEPTHDWLMTPQFNIPEDGTTEIRYWLWYHSEESYVNKFYIMVYDYEEETWEQGYSLANAFNSPYHYIEEYIFDLAQWKGKTVKIAFVKNGTYQMAMDDINIVTTSNSNIQQSDDKENIAIYPNPVIDFLNINTSEDLNSIVIYNSNGAVVKQINNKQSLIDCSELFSGIYFIETTTPKGKKTSKFIKK
jgi:hypothetical protein